MSNCRVQSWTPIDRTHEVVVYLVRKALNNVIVRIHDWRGFRVRPRALRHQGGQTQGRHEKHPGKYILIYFYTPVWTDLAKFRHYGRFLKVFGNLKKINLVFVKILNLFLQIMLGPFGPIVLVVNGSILKKNSSHLVTLLLTWYIIQCFLKSHWL